MSDPNPSTPAARLAAVVFTDVVGYSTRMQRDEAGTIALVRGDFGRMREACARHGGEVVNTMGDGMLMCFASVVEAVSFALEVQAEFGARKKSQPPERTLEHRIGVHLGDVHMSTGDVGLQGDGVIIAARLESQAPPGGICMSQTVYDTVKGKVPMQARFAGSVTLKNIPQPVPAWHAMPEGSGDFAARKTGAARAFKGRSAATALAVVAVLAIGAYVVIHFRASPSDNGTKKAGQASAHVLAVLPFQDMRTGAGDDHFAESLQEEMLDGLAKAGNWQLVSRTSMSQAGAGAGSMKSVAARVGATHVIEGSIRRDGKDWRLTVQLIEAATDTHLFSYSDNMSADFPVNDVQRHFVTLAVARVRFMLADQPWAYAIPEAEMPGNARLLYRRGAMEMRYAASGIGHERPEVLRLLNEAHALAPRDGRVVALLALAEAKEAGFGIPPERLQRIERKLQEAESLSPGIPEIALARGWLALFAGRPAPVILGAFDSAGSRLAGNYEWQLGRAFALRFNGEVEKALLGFEQAISLDGYDDWPVANVALLRIGTRRLDAAIEYLDQAQKRWPLRVWTAIRLMDARLFKDGDVAQARLAVEEWRKRYRVKADDLLLRSVLIQLAMLDGRLKEATESLASYPEDQLESASYPPPVFRQIYRVPMKLGLLAVQGRMRELAESAGSSRLALARMIKEESTDVGRFELSLMKAQAEAFLGERAKALSQLRNVQDAMESRQKLTFENNRYHLDVALGWLWAGERDKALTILENALTENVGGFAPIVARDPIWCPLYGEPRFATLLEAHGQRLVKHPGACVMKR